MFTCELCGKTYKTKKPYEKHVATCTGVEAKATEELREPTGEPKFFGPDLSGKRASIASKVERQYFTMMTMSAMGMGMIPATRADAAVIMRHSPAVAKQMGEYAASNVWVSDALDKVEKYLGVFTIVAIHAPMFIEIAKNHQLEDAPAAHDPEPEKDPNDDLSTASFA